MMNIQLSPGEGWGDGTHETTRMCLQAITLFAPKKCSLSARGSSFHQGPHCPHSPHCHHWKMLDFGSGSGVLAIQAAKLGAKVDAVEIDEAGLFHGKENARLNCVENQIRFMRTLSDSHHSYEFVIANILRPVLLEFASSLTQRLAPGGTLVLSGLVATDIPDVSVRYSALLGGMEPQIFRRKDWCTLAWLPKPNSKF